MTTSPTEITLEQALQTAFEERGHDGPRISIYGGKVLLHWGGLRGDTVQCWTHAGVLHYARPAQRMTREGGRLQAIRAAAKAMALEHREA